MRPGASRDWEAAIRVRGWLLVTQMVVLRPTDRTHRLLTQHTHRWPESSVAAIAIRGQENSAIRPPPHTPPKKEKCRTICDVMQYYVIAWKYAILRNFSEPRRLPPPLHRFPPRVLVLRAWPLRVHALLTSWNVRSGTSSAPGRFPPTVPAESAVDPSGLYSRFRAPPFSADLRFYYLSGPSTPQHHYRRNRCSA